jgi:hypothetical protein
VVRLIQTKKPKLLMGGHTDEMYTPKYALNPLLPYLNRDWTIWECAYGNGALKKHLIDFGFKVVGQGEDFFSTDYDCDVIVTNPPYSKKYEFLERAYQIGKPFAFLMPLTALEGIKRGALYETYGIQLIIPNRRINFITPNKGKASWFATAWFTNGLDLERDLIFVTLDRGEENEGI